MSTEVINGYLFTWNKNLDYAQRLVADLTEEQMVAQPATNPDAPSNHAAWILSHLNAYLPVIASIIKDEEFEDPKHHPFGMLSKPESSRDVYESKEVMVQAFVDGHQNVIELLSRCDDSVFGNQIKLSRWESVMPTAGIALPYLMLNHENMHLGQLSAWRRIQGLPSV